MLGYLGNHCGEVRLVLLEVGGPGLRGNVSIVAQPSQHLTVGCWRWVVVWGMGEVRVIVVGGRG